jgi:hypothetical protein
MPMCGLETVSSKPSLRTLEEREAQVEFDRDGLALSSNHQNGDRELRPWEEAGLSPRSWWMKVPPRDLVVAL